MAASSGAREIGDGNGGRLDAVIVGGGVAGLATGALLAAGGRRVVVLEKGNQVGGRANTHREQGFTLNYGPHGVYRPRTGLLADVLRRLGRPPIPHGYPDPRRSYFALDGRWGVLGASPLDLLRTPLFPPASRLRLLRLMLAVRLAAPDAAGNLTYGEWLERRTRDPLVGRFLLALATLNSYTRPAAGLSAASVLRHFQRHLFARDYVGYMSGGWSTMYQAFADVITGNGGQVRAGAAVTALEARDGEVVAALTAGDRFEAGAFVVAVPPADMPALAPAGSALRTELERWQGLDDARALCVDLGFSRRLRTDLSFIYDVASDFYFSVHSEITPDLAPPGCQLLHAMAYLSPEEAADDALHEERHRLLLAGLDRYFPGWREAVVVQRTLPAAPVAPIRRTPAQEGARVPARSSVCRNLYFAGDARDFPYQLSETCLASALQVADLLLAEARAAVATPAAVG